MDAGAYRALVKGYAKSTVGAFALTVDCSGDGCSEAGGGPKPDGGGVPVADCLFGDGFGPLREGETSVRVQNHRTWSSPSGLEDLERAQVLAAVRVAYEEAATVEEAFESVDQGLVERYVLWDEAGSRTFLALEYGAGDNSFGVIFVAGTTEVAATIVDGDLDDCAVFTQ